MSATALGCAPHRWTFPHTYGLASAPWRTSFHCSTPAVARLAYGQRSASRPRPPRPRWLPTCQSASSVLTSPRAGSSPGCPFLLPCTRPAVPSDPSYPGLSGVECGPGDVANAGGSLPVSVGALVQQLPGRPHQGVERGEREGSAHRHAADTEVGELRDAWDARHDEHVDR